MGIAILEHRGMGPMALCWILLCCESCEGEGPESISVDVASGWLERGNKTGKSTISVFICALDVHVIYFSKLLVISRYCSSNATPLFSAISYILFVKEVKI